MEKTHGTMTNNNLMERMSSSDNIEIMSRSNRANSNYYSQQKMKGFTATF